MPRTFDGVSEAALQIVTLLRLHGRLELGGHVAALGNDHLAFEGAALLHERHEARELRRIGVGERFPEVGFEVRQDRRASAR